MNRVWTDKRPICSIQVPDRHDISRRLTASSSSRFVRYGVCGGRDTSVIFTIYFIFQFGFHTNSKTNVLLLGNQKRIELFFFVLVYYTVRTLAMSWQRDLSRGLPGLTASPKSKLKPPVIDKQTDLVLINVRFCLAVRQVFHQPQPFGVSVKFYFPNISRETNHLILASPGPSVPLWVSLLVLKKIKTKNKNKQETRNRITTRQKWRMHCFVTIITTYVGHPKRRTGRNPSLHDRHTRDTVTHQRRYWQGRAM